MVDQRISSLVDAAGVARARLTNATQQRVGAQLARFDGWYQGELVQELAGQLGETVDGAARLAANQADANQFMLLDQVTSGSVYHGPSVVDGSMRAGVTAQDAYHRLFPFYRYQQSIGLDHGSALGLVLDRANRMTQMDVALAAREQARATLAANSGVAAGFRRILRPELSKTGPCGLCIVAADRVYGSFDLLPLHGGCRCEVAPVVDGQDIGRELNREDLDRLYQAAGGTGGYGLREVRVEVTEHGELGPILKEASASMRGPSQVVQDAHVPDKQQLEQQIAILEKSLRENRARQIAGEDRSQPIGYLAGQLSKLKADYAARFAV